MSFGSPAIVQVGPMPYPVMNTLLDDAFPKGALNYWRSTFAAGLSDALIDTAGALRGGALADVPDAPRELPRRGDPHRVSDTAVPHRQPGWNLLVPSVWMDPGATDENVAWTRETHAALLPHLGRGPLAQLPRRRRARRRGPRRLRAQLRAAAELKRRYDPDNVFRHNANIDP